MGKKDVIGDRPAYLSADDAKYSLGVHRGPLPPPGIEGSTKLEEIESAGGVSLATAPLTRKQKFARHWKRFWFVHLIANIILLAILLPIFFLVVLPAVSQLVVNKSTLTLVNASVMKPRPDSVQLTLQSSLDLHILLPVRIEPITLELYVGETGPEYPWADVTIPGLKVHGITTLGVENVPTPLINTTVWTDYVREVVFQKEAALGIKGATNSYLGVLKAHVNMQKNVVSPTLNSFHGFSISGSTLLLPPRPDGTNLIGYANLPNPSVLTIEIGSIVLDIKSGDLVIGNATLENFTLKPGDNNHPISGVLDLATILSNLGEVIKSQKQLFTTGDLNLATVTRSVVWNGEEVPYYTEVMSELTLVAHVPLIATLKNTFAHLNLTSLENYLHPSTNSSGGGLLGSGAFSSKSRSTANLASELKQNVHVREAFGDEDPIKRDEMIDSLAGMYMKSS